MFSIRITSLLHLMALVSAGVLPASAQRASPPAFTGTFAVPFIGCDCDPKDFVFATRVPLAGYTQPDALSERVRTVERNRRIEGNDWSEAWTETVRPGRIAVRRTTTLSLVPLGRGSRLADLEAWPPARRVTIARGSEIETLLHSGEGGMYVRIDGEVYFDDGLLWGDAFHVVREPVEQVWLRLTPKPDGRPAAWVAVDWYSEDGRANVEALCGTHSPCGGF